MWVIQRDENFTSVLNFLITYTKVLMEVFVVSTGTKFIAKRTRQIPIDVWPNNHPHRWHGQSHRRFGEKYWRSDDTGRCRSANQRAIKWYKEDETRKLFYKSCEKWIMWTITTYMRIRTHKLFIHDFPLVSMFLLSISICCQPLKKIEKSQVDNKCVTNLRTRVLYDLFL